MIYLIGSLRNPEVPRIAKELRKTGQEVFDDWYAAGPEADDKWREYEQSRGRSYHQALSGLAAKHVFHFDRDHLDRADAVCLVLPAGKSGHLELGWALGRGKRGYILLDNPDRWDVMYQFATGIFTDINELIRELNKPVEPEFLEWYNVADPSIKGRIKNPKYTGVPVEPPNNIIPEVSNTDIRICATCHRPETSNGCACWQRSAWRD